jgi:GNAT superfamily N-acetyltransferase
MLRPATAADLPAIVEIRDGSGTDRLSDPRRASDTELARLIGDGAIWLRDEDGAVLGFVAVDRTSGSIVTLLVAPGHDGKGVGRGLLAAGCGALREVGHATATLTTEPGSAAERHYHAAGWTLNGRNAEGGAIFAKPL